MFQDKKVRKYSISYADTSNGALTDSYVCVQGEVNDVSITTVQNICFRKNAEI